MTAIKKYSNKVFQIKNKCIQKWDHSILDINKLLMELKQNFIMKNSLIMKKPSEYLLKLFLIINLFKFV